jgi:hypothetical protein
MPISTPLAASGARGPSDRARRIPQSVKCACLLMIEEAVDFVTAAKASGLRPDTMRRWLHRPEVLSFLRRERAAFRQAVCSANERVLAQIRDDREGNQMARVHAIKTLEQLEDDAVAKPANLPAPGIVIRIVNQPPIDVSPSRVIEHDAAKSVATAVASSDQWTRPTSKKPHD